MVVENCTVEDLGHNYEAHYHCGPNERQTEVRVVEKDAKGGVLWSYVVRPGGIMCE